MKASPFLYLAGQGKEVIDFYKLLGFKFFKEFYCEKDFPEFNLKKGDIKYAAFSLGETRVDMDSTGKKVLGSLIIDFEINETDKMNHMWSKLKESGSVELELQKFPLPMWDAMMGIVTDQFGIKWQFHMVIPR